MSHINSTINTFERNIPELTFSSDSYEFWMPTLEGLGDDRVLAAWRAHEKYLQDSDCRAWLEFVGGISLNNIKTEFQLLDAAHMVANNKLLFGLAHGKFVDALANHGHYPSLEMMWGITPHEHAALSDLVLRQGRDYLDEASKCYPNFEMPFHGSRHDVETLLSMTVEAPDAYCLGNLTAWLLTAHDMHQAEKENRTRAEKFN